MAYKTINPYTNELLKEYTDATDEELESTLPIHLMYPFTL